MTEEIYKKVVSLISEWKENDIYAVSFLVYSNPDYEYKGIENVSQFCISYNTESFCSGAGKYDEERWNYAFWPQDEEYVIDVDNSTGLMEKLFQWYKENGITDIGYENEDNNYNENGDYIGKGPNGHYELLCLVSDVALRLQKEEFFMKKFGKAIPIIVHGLEYAWYDIEATKKANPDGQATDFLIAMSV